MTALVAAADRFFRAYDRHSVAPDEDTLFNLLNALHSFHDKLREATGRDLFGSQNFLALKALRNFFHHEAELLHEIKIVAVKGLPIVTDLAYVCLIDRNLAIRAAEHQKQNRGAVEAAFKWYGSIANIQPCIFNGAVDVFEVIEVSGIKPSSDSDNAFDASYRFEEKNGYSHRVSGDIACRAGDVGQILRDLYGLPGSAERA